jgi:hypothetical protein
MKQVKNIHEVLTELNKITEGIRLRKEADREIDHQAVESTDIQNDGGF